MQELLNETKQLLLSESTEIYSDDVFDFIDSQFEKTGKSLKALITKDSSYKQGNFIVSQSGKVEIVRNGTNLELRVGTAIEPKKTRPIIDNLFKSISDKFKVQGGSALVIKTADDYRIVVQKVLGTNYTTIVCKY